MFIHSTRPARIYYTLLRSSQAKAMSISVGTLDDTLDDDDLVDGSLCSAAHYEILRRLLLRHMLYQILDAIYLPARPPSSALGG